MVLVGCLPILPDYYWKNFETGAIFKAQFLILNDLNAKCISVGKFNDIKNVLKVWIDVREPRNNPVSDNFIKYKAEDFAKQFGIENLAKLLFMIRKVGWGFFKNFVPCFWKINCKKMQKQDRKFVNF